MGINVSSAIYKGTLMKFEEEIESRFAEDGKILRMYRNDIELVKDWIRL